MNKLTRNIFLLAVTVVMVLTAMVFLIPADTNSYLAAAKDKHRLLHEVESPRIILVGGSNVAFGINSQKIEERFHMPVINMGLHADLVLHFIFDEVRAVLKDGDIVIVFPEYELFFDSLDGDPKYLGAVIKSCPECMLSADSPHQFLNFGIGLLQTLEGDLTRNIRVESPRYGTYSRRSFDRHGDIVRRLKFYRESNLFKPLVLPANIIDSLQRSQTIELFNSFSQSCKASNVRVFLIFPSIFVDDFNNQKKQFTDLSGALKDSLEIPILGEPQDFIYPNEMFFDTFYHLNSVGRNKRTNRVIQLLEPVLEK